MRSARKGGRAADLQVKAQKMHLWQELQPGFRNFTSFEHMSQELLQRIFNDSSSCAGIARGGAGLGLRRVLPQVLRERRFCRGIVLFFAIPATKLAIYECCVSFSTSQ